MALIPQQAIITFVAQTMAEAEKQLIARLESYPDVRIVSVSAAAGLVDRIHLIAVIETV
jgi:hypothetical protein